jgi:ABC-type dipeptide/oligopeptide/nickel transport system permease subunit
VAASADALDAARKVSATFAAFTGLSLVIGAFIGAVSGAIGGRLRDMHP